MNIGIVLPRAFSSGGSGLQRYATDLTKNLLEYDKKNFYYIFVENHVDLAQLYSYFGRDSRYKIIKVDGGVFWLQFGLFFRLKSLPRMSAMIFYNTLPLFFKGKNAVLIVCDFYFKYFKSLKLKLLDFLIKDSLEKARKVVSISESTKNDALRFYNVNKEKILVIYPGFVNLCKERKSRALKINKPFILFVGSMKERKNVLNMIKAYAIFKKQKNASHKFIVAGKYDKESDYFKEIDSFIKSQNLSNDIFLLNQVTDEELAYLYKNADSLFFATKFEGFGFPVLEAMSCGVPVIATNAYSLKEISKGCAILVNPDSIAEMAEALSEVSFNKSLRPELIKKGYANALKYSWKKAVKKFIELIEQLNNNPGY